MDDMFWAFVKDTADSGSWSKCHAAMTALVPAVALATWLLPDPPIAVYLVVSMALGNLFRHAVLYPMCVRLMDRQRTRQFAG